MTTRHFLHDAGHCLRAAAPPLLTLGLLAAARSVHLESPMPSPLDRPVLLAWQASTVASALWLTAAMGCAATRSQRDRRAFQRLQALRDGSRSPDRALVHLWTAIWSSNAGQLVTVIDIATGRSHRLWLPEEHMPVGAFALLERLAARVRVVDWIDARAVGAGQRHERCHATADLGTSAEVRVPCEQDNAAALIREAEEFLRSI